MRYQCSWRHTEWPHLQRISDKNEARARLPDSPQRNTVCAPPAVAKTCFYRKPDAADSPACALRPQAVPSIGEAKRRQNLWLRALPGLVHENGVKS